MAGGARSDDPHPSFKTFQMFLSSSPALSPKIPSARATRPDVPVIQMFQIFREEKKGRRRVVSG